MSVRSPHRRGRSRLALPYDNRPAFRNKSARGKMSWQARIGMCLFFTMTIAGTVMLAREYFEAKHELDVLRSGVGSLEKENQKVLNESQMIRNYLDLFNSDEEFKLREIRQRLNVMDAGEIRIVRIPK